METAPLDRSTWPEFRDAIANYVPSAGDNEPRSYPGYPRWPLSRRRPAWWPGLERVLWRRRSGQNLGNDLPSRAVLSRILQYSHGVSAPDHRGPTPSAGGLQALELYLVNLTPSWLPCGVYHYGRRAHELAQVRAGAERSKWNDMVPSLALIPGGSVAWVLIGDGARAAAKYGERSQRFLLLEAGHLMQNLCLMSARSGWTTVPLGGFFEAEIARAMALPVSDLVLYVGLLGFAVTPGRLP